MNSIGYRPEIGVKSIYTNSNLLSYTHIVVEMALICSHCNVINKSLGQTNNDLEAFCAKFATVSELVKQQINWNVISDAIACSISRCTLRGELFCGNCHGCVTCTRCNCCIGEPEMLTGHHILPADCEYTICSKCN